MSKQLVHQLGGNIAKQMVKGAEMAMEEASKLLKTTEKWVIGGLTSSSILFWVGIVALLVFVVWKPWEHLTFESMEEKKEDGKDDEKELLSKDNLGLMVVVGVFAVLVIAVLLYMMKQ